MKAYLVLAAGFAGLLVARSALPCGAPFGLGISANPQQDIIVVHKNGVETYVFQPTFCGTASNFGLILPVPSLLTTSPELSGQQAFTTVDSLSQPTYVTVTSCSPYRAGSGGTSGTGSAGVDAAATVVSSGRVGFLDWVQLKADTEASFTDWLTANGYPYSAAASSVFSYYVQNGWYFVAFKISQGVTPDGGSARADGGSGVVCNALGPVKLSFPSTVPVVPSRMASAGTVPTGSYSYAFSWRIFGITSGDQQLAFTDGANGSRVLGYSGALGTADVSALTGLALAGDRLTKLTLTFSYGSTDPDVGLSLASASDYRETRYIYQYVLCLDAGTYTAVDTNPGFVADVALAADAGTKPDAPLARDAGTAAGLDAIPASVADVALALDAETKPDVPLAPDAGTAAGLDAIPASVADVALAADAGTKPDAPWAPGDGATDTRAPRLAAKGSGCSVAGGSTSGGFLALLALAGRIRRRRRR
jgi:MYXO-CTERM domain-containing protein